MKRQRCTTFYFSLFAACFTGIVAQEAKAELDFEEFRLTSRSVSFRVSGTLPAAAPNLSGETLFFSNPSVSPTQALSLEDFSAAESATFSGTQELGFSEPVQTGAVSFGDYFFVNFDSKLSPGEIVDGILSAEWDRPAFDPAAVDSLNVYWGVGSTGGAVDTGTFIGNAPITVPEPGSFLLLGTLYTALSVDGRRNRGCASK